GWYVTRAAFRSWDGWRARQAAQGDPERKASEDAFRLLEATVLKEPKLDRPAARRKEASWAYTLGLYSEIRGIVNGRLMTLGIPEEFQVRSARLDELLRLAGLARGDVDLYEPQLTLKEHANKVRFPNCDLTTTLTWEEERGNHTFDAEGKNLSVAGHKVAAFVLEYCLDQIQLLPEPDLPLPPPLIN
ncbi:MAG: hypothetical protein ACRD1Z_05855, partial [Vicinamibacteria bacterium]